MKILVTGYKGYIGSRLYKKLINLGYDVDGIDLKDNKNIIDCLPDENYDFVFHLAAFPSVQFSVENPSYTMKNNVLSSSVLLEWCVKNKVKRLIFSSSAAAINIESPYGLQKRITEKECKLFSKLYGLDTVCLRYYNVYSEDQEFNGPYSTVINHWMNSIKNNQPLFLDGDGEQTRDFIHVDDVVGANIFCMNVENNFNGDVIDVGVGVETSLRKIKFYIDQTNHVSWIERPQRNGDIKKSKSNPTKLISLGWEPNISIQEGLKRCFKKELK
tara:strand:- start:840 stop:1655 length:816 start_codon:yes stop_codon:yes gene_type:complete